MSEKSLFTIMEHREETMVSPFGGDPFFRKAHFLEPTVKKNIPVSPFCKNQNFDVKNTPLQIMFRGTVGTLDRWIYWVKKLLPKYQNIWKAAGIYDSVLNSCLKLSRHKDLIFSLAEKWCVETNTFVFPWGESTVTLEDMIVLGGYSVLGNNVFSPLGTSEMREMKEKLLKIRKELSSTNKKFTSHLAWMDRFIDSNDELEHVAFLTLWLLKFVFSLGYGGIAANIFPAAIHLATGIRLAIAPTVLAIIYRDLSFLKKAMISSPEKSSIKSGVVSAIWGPVHLVQVWAWERIPTLRPSPNAIQVGETRLARWHEQVQLEVYDIRKALDSAGEDFEWRPYCKAVNNWKFNEFYRKYGELVVLESGMINEEIESFVLCIRAGELVGLGDSIEQYVPHRVAMQFGFDQDIPDFVPRVNNSIGSAWGYFKRAIADKQLYIPPRLLESEVTVRYLTWRNPAMLSKEDRTENNMERAPAETDKRHHQASQEFNKDEKDSVSLDEDDLTIEEFLRSNKKIKVVAGDGFVREDKCLMGANSENLPPLGLETGASKNVEMVPEAIGICSTVDIYAKYTSSSKVIRVEKEIPSDGKPGAQHFDLEARISKLERMLPMLEAKKNGFKSKLG